MFNKVLNTSLKIFFSIWSFSLRNYQFIGQQGKEEEHNYSLCDSHWLLHIQIFISSFASELLPRILNHSACNERLPLDKINMFINSSQSSGGFKLEFTITISVQANRLTEKVSHS